ncbi:hypothetical protein [Novosphingobium sp.]|uniref:hypothetical protein n=1 Tax=Novosphingobium sp. TaxID=1874826 RepID=UPI0025DB5AE6|nr:hypothetical protein [Novosphingobium sp.]MCC6925283.1 hypothetical protein [Novosphingobium sp.]
MTPLAQYLARLMPAWLVGPALACAYAVMLICVLIASSNDAAQIIYIDVRGQ